MGTSGFTDSTANKIGRITPAGMITELPIPTVGPVGITAGPDGNLWFTKELGNKIGRITTRPIPPMGADFDGDNKTEVAVYRNSLGQWWIRKSSDGGFIFVPTSILPHAPARSS